jgi:hypothetical protein
MPVNFMQFGEYLPGYRPQFLAVAFDLSGADKCRYRDGFRLMWAGVWRGFACRFAGIAPARQPGRGRVSGGSIDVVGQPGAIGEKRPLRPCGGFLRDGGW